MRGARRRLLRDAMRAAVLYEIDRDLHEIDPEAQYTIFHPSDVELSDTISSVLKQVDSLTPQRVVFDSLSELRMLAREPLAPWL